MSKDTFFVFKVVQEQFEELQSQFEELHQKDDFQIFIEKMNRVHYELLKKVCAQREDKVEALAKDIERLRVGRERHRILLERMKNLLRCPGKESLRSKSTSLYRPPLKPLININPDW